MLNDLKKNIYILIYIYIYIIRLLVVYEHCVNVITKH